MNPSQEILTDLQTGVENAKQGGSAFFMIMLVAIAIFVMREK